jgi:cardiolipin synthase
LINLPNLFTLIRLFLAPFIARAILSGSYGQAIVLFFIAGVSDAVDGYLARRMHESTSLGAISIRLPTRFCCR